MKRYSLSSKRNALIISFVFMLFYVLFQFWSYYNIVEKTISVSDETTVPHSEPKFYHTTTFSSTHFHRINRKKVKSSVHNIFISDVKSDVKYKSFWERIEENVNMNYSKEFEYALPEIHPMFRHLYRPNEDGTFTCFQSGERIHHSKINDDFCDCHDGSDEPSTSACHKGRFYCKYQSRLEDLSWVPSSRVNDGVCDCIDGSDEARPFKVPSLESRGQRSRTCKDKTEEIRKKENDFNKMIADGLKVKNEWISEVSGNKAILENKLYGHNGEFYKISTSPSCWVVVKAKYTYKICPFHVSTQESLNNKIIIGRKAVWIKYDPHVSKIGKRRSPPENYILESSDGDTRNCPDKKSRKIIIKFTCDVVNRIIDISEDELCVYKAQFSSPAAC